MSLGWGCTEEEEVDASVMEGGFLVGGLHATETISRNNWCRWGGVGWGGSGFSIPRTNKHRLKTKPTFRFVGSHDWFIADQEPTLFQPATLAITLK